MRIKLAASCILLSTLLAPFSIYAADSDKAVSTTKEFVKDSVITTKIKAKLAEEKMSSTIHIKVDTGNKGIVQLSGTAKTQADIDKAGAIAYWRRGRHFCGKQHSYRPASRRNASREYEW